MIVFVALAVAATLGLAYWQWTRFQSGSGTFQNLGYALQWPFFGAFIVYAYRSYLKYENEMLDDGEDVSPVDRRIAERGEMTEIDENFLPRRPSVDVDTFNSLNEQRRSPRSPSAETNESS
ncbi:hypothetical protein CCICO_02460 [Corynebacterium ciconiae DSM 44920]|uniref:hypothetical protein n=1 Tax=Corynebacterium ciconiae TaxID=227319 RepID=UPI0003763C1B|nr:hypothetical protein [Corynebacterium ciconiae]WKD60543.1 hypothetical protein CCICO_02460 [Corynebacterium ciconiae DSM 44920]